ncbi:MAG: hypothetical protein NE330_03495 [Lentisphaeraceae bacterium]|nr:hypothetical protein [Lentisphaeraceae bacterium]
MNKGITKQFALVKQTLLCDLRSVGLGLLQLVLAAIVFFCFFIFQQRFRYGRQVSGLPLFESISILNIFFAFIASLCLFLPLIREEKEEDTLGLILMTGISPFAYVLGKFGSRFITFAKLISLQIPFIVLCVTFGGVTLDMVFTSYLLISCYLFLLSSITFIISLLTTSIFSGIIIFIPLTVGFHFIMNCLEPFGRGFRLDTIIFYPIELMNRVVSSGVVGADHSKVIFFCSFCLLVGFLFYNLGIFFFNTLNTRQFKEYEVLDIKKKTMAMFSFGFIKNFLKRRFAKQAIIDKDFRFNFHGQLLWGVQFFAFLVIVVWLKIYYPYYGAIDVFHFLMAISFLMIIIILISSANQFFGFELKNQTFESILILPFTHKELFWKKMVALVLTSFPCLCVIVLGTLYDDYISDYHQNHESFFYLFFFNFIVGATIIRIKSFKFRTKVSFVITMLIAEMMVLWNVDILGRIHSDELWVSLFIIESVLTWLLVSLYIEKYRFFISGIAAVAIIFLHVLCVEVIDEFFRINSRETIYLVVASVVFMIMLLYDRILYSMKRVGEKS